MEVRPGYKKTEIGIIPEDWDVDKLSTLCDVRDGTHDSPQYVYSGIPLLTSKNIINGKIDLFEIAYITNTDAQQINKRSKVDIGDILMSMIGTVGNLVLVKEEPNYCIKNVALIKPKYIENRYLIYALSSPFFQTYIINSLNGGIQKFISLGVLRKMDIAYPKINEQKEISRYLKDIDSLILSLEKLIVKKKFIKQGVMQELLTGKRRLPEFSGEWETKTYGEVFQFFNTATYPREDITKDGELKYLHYGDIHTKWNQFLDLENGDIPSISNEKLCSYSLIIDGDVVMVDASEDYSSIGKSIEVINKKGIKAIAGLHTYLLRDTNKVFVNGYRGYIHSIQYVKKQYDTLATGMKVYGVSKLNLKKVLILVPPKPEQEAILEILQSMGEEIRSLEQQLSKYKLLKQGMMEELLTGRIRLV